MKFAKFLTVLGLCVLILQLAFVNCEPVDDFTETENTEETSATDTVNQEDTGTANTENEEDSGATDTQENVDENTGEVVDTSGGSDTENEVDGENIDNTSEVDQSAENTNTDTVGEENGDSEVVEASDDTSAAVEEDATPAPPAVGTTLEFTMDTKTEGEGIDVSIYFTQMEEALQMHCEVSVQPGTAAATHWPNEFQEDEEVSTEDEGSGDSVATADEDSDDSGSNVVEGDENAVSTDEETGEVSSSNNVEEASSVENSDTVANSAADDDAESNDNEDAPEVENENEPSDSVSENENANTESEAVDSENDANIVSEEDEATGSGQNRATSCDGTMPHLYLIKDTSCCSDTHQEQCKSAEGKKLGCIEVTGTVEHDFTDLSYYEVQEYCLAITDKEVPTAFRSTPRFIAAGPSFFRTFGTFNFDSVNLLSSGLKTVTSSSSTGAISINFPASSPSYSGGTYNPGILDTLPFIRLEGISADHVNVVIVLLILTYLATIFFPLLNLGSLFSGLSAPFSRMGDFASEKMDILAGKVRASIRNYNRRYHNNIRRVDYDLNYEYYDDEDYYYYVK